MNKPYYLCLDRYSLSAYGSSASKEVRGRRLMFVIELVPNVNLPLDKIHKELFDAGYITGVNLLANTLRFYPPLTIEKEHITRMVNSLYNILAKYNL